MVKVDFLLVGVTHARRVMAEALLHDADLFCSNFHVLWAEARDTTVGLSAHI